MLFRLTTSDCRRHPQPTEYRWAEVSSYRAAGAWCEVAVIAADEAEARKVAAECAGDEGPPAWLDESTIVEQIDPNGPAELLGWCG